MALQAILLVHGMGAHEAPSNGKRGSFCTQFSDATTESLRTFSNHLQDELSQHIDLHEFNYDAWLNKIREIMADKSAEVEERLSIIGEHYGISFPLELGQGLLALEDEYREDEFFYTHWLDVFFYASVLGAKIRVDAGHKIAELMQRYGAGNVHIVAHSLGTAVIHDTIDRLYRSGFDPNDGIPDLHPGNHRLGSIWMFANVSRLVNTITGFADPYNSIVRPGYSGCANSFVNVRHELDPFTWLARFDPSDNGQWLDRNTYGNYYTCVVTRLVLERNPHSFRQYLQDPAVVDLLLSRFHPALIVDPDEFSQFKINYEAKAINGAYAALRSALANLEVKEEVTWHDFFRAAKALTDSLRTITGELA